MIFPEKNISPENYLLFLPSAFLLIGSKLLYKRNWVRTFFSLLLSVFLYTLILIPAVIMITLFAFGII